MYFIMLYTTIYAMSLMDPVAHSIAQAETDDDTLKDEMAQQYKMMQSQNRDPQAVPLTWDQKKKQKGIKRFFGK